MAAVHIADRDEVAEAQRVARVAGAHAAAADQRDARAVVGDFTALGSSAARASWRSTNHSGSPVPAAMPTSASGNAGVKVERVRSFSW